MSHFASLSLSSWKRKAKTKTILIAFAFALLVHAPSAMAASTICDGDCGILDAVDRGDGMAFSFALGVVGMSTDESYTIKSKRNIYLVGPVDANSARLKARSIILTDSTNLPDATKLKTKNLIESFTSVADPVMAGALRSKSRVKEKRGRVSIKSNGDVYVNVSGLDLNKLKIDAKGTIFVSDTSLGGSNPVPEPSTAILMALGLVGLSLRRVRKGAL